MTEYLDYSFFLRSRSLGRAVEGWVRDRIHGACHAAAAGPMGWPGHARVGEAVKAGSRYFREALRGEAILTIGSGLLGWRHGEIDAVVAAGPLECMPNKLAEAQLHHAARADGLLSLTLSLNGEPPDPDLLDGFAHDVHERFHARRSPVCAAGRGEAGALVPALRRDPQGST